MKKILFIITIVSIVSCGKDKITTTTNCKLSEIIHKNGANTDSVLITYSGDNLSLRYNYSSSSTVYTYDYIKSGSQYSFTRYTNGVQSLDGFFTLNTEGYVDTSRITHIPAMTFNNRSKYYYDANGYLIRAVTDYNTYINDVKYYYNSDGNYSYWIYDVFYPLTPASNSKDSVVFEYYLDKPKKGEINAFENKYGKPVKNLVKKWSFYDLLNSNVLRKTYDYEYITDANALISRQIFVYRNQPGDVFVQTDTTYYKYNCN